MKADPSIIFGGKKINLFNYGNVVEPYLDLVNVFVLLYQAITTPIRVDPPIRVGMAHHGTGREKHHSYSISQKKIRNGMGQEGQF